MWYSKIVGDGMTAYEETDEIASAFAGEYAERGKPIDMAVFTRHVSEGHLQCEVTAYFSPAAEHIARHCGAEPCVQPARDGLVLLAGDEGAWTALF